uniref:CSON007321 protein n=1 Tax=Culicoides sonorensis TaxID=179676 RepID=A0A336KCY8_CULSO
MGVRGLETFTKTNVDNGSFDVNMPNMIKSHQQASGTEALIVVDIEGMKLKFTPMEEMLVGMCSDIYCGRVRTFFQCLKDAGAKFVFFSDGPPQEDKHATWFKRQNQKYEDHLKVIDKIDRHYSIKKLVDDHVSGKDELPSNNMTQSLLRAVCKEFGELHVSIHNECDLELAAFATQNNAYAILADDSDFLIYPGRWRYWSIKNIDEEKFTTLGYNRVALRSALSLSEHQMPLFAALGGNDIVQYEDIKQFHQRIGVRNKFINIAHYVRPIPLNLIDDVLEKLAEDVFCHKENWKKYTSYLKKGCEIYDIRQIQFPIQCSEDEWMKKILDGHLKTVYVILKDIPFSITTMYMDYRYFLTLRCEFCKKNPNFSLQSRDRSKVTYTELAIEIRSRIVGVIMQHRNDSNYKSKAIAKLSHESPYRQILITPKYPEIQVPDLDKLLFPVDDDGLDPSRKLLFQWILTGKNNHKIDTDRLFALPKDYICTVATLFYMVKEGYLTVDDADIILYSIYLAFTKHKFRYEMMTPEYLLKDAFLTTFMFLKLHGFIRRIFKVVGLKKYMELVKFDGFFYHKIQQVWPVGFEAIKLYRLYA